MSWNRKTPKFGFMTTHVKLSLAELSAIFDKQFPCLPNGRFCNPKLVDENSRDMEFRCHYDDYDNEDDSWTWYFDKKVGEFYS